jgi:hypothetical protein
MSRKQTTLLGWLVPAAVLILLAAWWLAHGPTHRTPANFKATPAEGIAAAPADDPLPLPPQPVERAAGGQLDNGQWQFGYTPDREGTRKFLQSLPRPTLESAAPHLLKQAASDKPVLLYRALEEAYAEFHAGQKWVVGKQGIGDCVSWGWAHGCDVCLAVEWKLGQTSEWRPAATEAIYGGSRVEARGASRGGYSDGSYGGAAAKWVHDWGALFRQPYPELGFDLTHYEASRAKSWGNFGCGGSGDNGKADKVAKTHPVRNVALVKNFEEAAAAIAAGYPVPVCSGQGFSSSRDKDGFSRASGSWAHCMCFIGVRRDKPGLLCLNSWGPNWISGPKWPADQPDGSFWVEAAVATRMLRGEDSFAVSAYEGFPYRDLKHGDWVMLERPAPAIAGHRQTGQRPLQFAGSEQQLTLAP